MLQLRLVESSGEEHALRISRYDSVDSLKKLVWHTTGVPFTSVWKCQRLFVNEKEITFSSSTDTLDLIKINDGDTIHLVENTFQSNMWNYFEISLYCGERVAEMVLIERGNIDLENMFHGFTHPKLTNLKK